MESMDANLLNAVAQLGAAPVTVWVVLRYMWSGMSEKMDKLENTLERMSHTMNQMDRRLITMEVQSRIEP